MLIVEDNAAACRDADGLAVDLKTAAASKLAPKGMAGAAAGASRFISGTPSSGSWFMTPEPE
mgnify:CR=1 FL=1